MPMTCVRSGYCCIMYDVIIVDNPKKGIRKNNLIHKPTGIRCQHLKGKSGEMICQIHEYPWYKRTPCFQYDQIGEHGSLCRMGEFVSKNPAMIDHLNSFKQLEHE